MRDVATDFKESARVDVNDVLDDIREDIMMNANDTDDLREALETLNSEVNEFMNVLNDTNKSLINLQQDFKRMAINHAECMQTILAMLQDLKKD